jgi:hypothetical protein
MLMVVLFSFESLSQEKPRVGRRAAAQYMGAGDAETNAAPADVSRQSFFERLMMLHVGSYSSSTSYEWKDSVKRQGVGKATYGVTYLWDQWNGLDLNLRFDFNEYKLDDVRATKLSIMPLWTLPMAETKFPLYFGFGLGAGVYFSQVDDESSLSLDYQLISGARFLDIYENLGAFIEFGLKNHLHILSDGQLNGTALSAGVVFTF